LQTTGKKKKPTMRFLKEAGGKHRVEAKLLMLGGAETN